MKRLVAVIVLICIICTVVGVICDRRENLGNGMSVMCNVRKNFRMKKRVAMKQYTKDFRDYRDTVGSDSMFIYGLFKMKKMVHDTFNLKFGNS